MKITLLNGNVVEGTANELVQAGLIPAPTMASIAVKPQLEMFPVSLTAQAEKPAVEEVVQEEAPAVASSPKAGRPHTAFTTQVYAAMEKLVATGTEQRLFVASENVSRVRSIVTRNNRIYNTQLKVNKFLNGNRVYLIISK